MHRVHGYSLQTQIGPSRASEKLFTPRSLNHLHALSLQNSLLAAFMENLEYNEPLHIDENNEWSAS
ncbi:hypothetical protein AJ62_02668 [Pseudomonas aeruginosa 3575]|nr:hypothetical protein AJ62_02668 [Pseudomonas aeruginosa 3575]GLE71575.1 hypothetical protein VNPA110517_54170 [Pseudomonas aeruginosa]